MDELPESSASGSNGGGQLEPLDYLRGVESSTCLLLTPSPTPLDFKHPLSEEMNEGPFITRNDEPIVNLQNLANCDASGGDSCSSGDSNSVVQDPVSAQLINNISMMDYQTLSKNADLVTGEVEDCKTNGSLNFGNRKLPNFVNWNWCIIRKVMLWVVLSGLVACLGAIIGMVISIPKICDPDLPWYQGKVFYEVFPASFKDSNNDDRGDLNGVIMKLDYIQSLNVSAIRLNYIYQANGYPEHYYNVTSLKNVDSSIGDLTDFEHLVTEVHNRNMSIILDIPVWSLAYPHSSSNHNHNDTQLKYSDPTSDAIDFWSRKYNVDGFYLKNLERYASDKDLGQTLKLWKQIIGFDKILIASEEAYNKAKGDNLNVLLSRIDLIDVHLDFGRGIINELKDKIKTVVNGALWTKPHYPWVHWNIGNINSPRVATENYKNALALAVLELILPGTVSIFYGDEIGLGDMPHYEVEQDYHEYENVRNLVQMKFSNNGYEDKNVMPKHVQWNPESGLQPKYDFLHIIQQLVKLRLRTPTIYLRSFFKDGNILKNMEIRNITDEAEQNLFIIERWYPRRNTCVFVANLGNSSITTDLTTMYYGGTVISGTNSSLIGQVMYFDRVTFPPNSAIVLKLEK